MNKTDLFKTLLYFIFPLTPLGVFYLYRIFQKRGLDIENFVNSFFKLVAIIQLPIILIQKYGYNFLIQFNNSNQRINDYDSMFGIPKSIPGSLTLSPEHAKEQRTQQR